MRDLPRRVPPPLPPDPRLLRAARQHGAARDGPHVVRRPGHDEAGGTTSGSTSRSPSGPPTTRSAEATEYTDAWTGFTNARKNWAYRQDQLPSTHPIAADNYDLEAVEVNFDGITYAKGASTLKQLVAWVGDRRVHRRPAGLLQDPRVRELRVQRPARARSRRRPAASWTPGPRSGCRPRASTRSPRSSRSTTTARSRRSAWPRPPLPSSRPSVGTASRSACTTSTGDHLVRRSSLEIDVIGDLTEVPELVGEKQPDLVLLNDGDLTYAKIRLDERSLATRRGQHRQGRRLARPGAALGCRLGHDPRRRDERATDFVGPRAARHRRRDRPHRRRAASPMYARSRGRVLLRPRHPGRAPGDLGAGRPRAARWPPSPARDHQLAFARGVRLGCALRRGARPARRPARRHRRPSTG